MRDAVVEELRDLFVRLAAIRSPSGEEREVADFVKAYGAGLGLTVEEDDTATSPSAAGNLVIRAPGRGAGTPVALCGHLDTVPLQRPPVVVCENGVVHTDGQTILGADDKAAVAALLLLLRDLTVTPPEADVEIVLTTREEVNLLGAKTLDQSALQAQVMFVFDSSGLPGSAIVAAPMHKLVTARFQGVAAHAGMAPEQGRSAILAAGRAIVALPQGRVDDETTANVGIVEGGSATNVVPDRCLVKAEARSRDEAKVGSLVQKMVDAIMLAATETGVDVDLQIEEHYRAYRHSPRSRVLRMASAAAAEAGLPFVPFESNGGSDANVFNSRGLPSLTLGVGFERVHSPEESMRLDRLAQVHALAHALVRVAGAQ